MCFALLIGIPAGILSAVRKGSGWDVGANAVSHCGACPTPNFWLGIMLIFLFSVKLGWLPASGFVSPFEDLPQSARDHRDAGLRARQCDRPAVLMRHMRSAMLQAMGADYVRTARAKGLLEKAVIMKHALRNALTPVITLGALELGTLLSRRGAHRASVSIPGFGKLIVDAVFNRDYQGGAGRGAGHRDRLHHAEPARRHRLRAGSTRGCADERRTTGRGRAAGRAGPFARPTALGRNPVRNPVRNSPRNPPRNPSPWSAARRSARCGGCSRGGRRCSASSWSP